MVTETENGLFVEFGFLKTLWEKVLQTEYFAYLPVAALPVNIHVHS